MSKKDEEDEYNKIVSEEKTGTRMLQVGLMLFFPGIFLIVIGFQQIKSILQPSISEILVLGIFVFVLGSSLLIYGAYLVNRASKEAKRIPPEIKFKKVFEHVPEELKFFSKVMGEALTYPKESNSKKSSSLKCPDCGAPLESRPPCNCSYCGRLIE